MDDKKSVFWNPWHGCTKVSPGCKNCYVYRRDEAVGNPVMSSECRKNQSFDMPIKKTRDGSYKLAYGSRVFTCFTSDFLLSDADEWRNNCWEMMRIRSDCTFVFFTKRIERLIECLPDDWGDGYDNVIIGCTVENQDRANYRLPIFKSLPIKRRYIIAEPLLERIDLSPYLDESIESVSAGGESGDFARECRYEWILDIRSQCVEKNVAFTFHQTGANFIKDGKAYKIDRHNQERQATRAGVNFSGSTEGKYKKD